MMSNKFVLWGTAVAAIAATTAALAAPGDVRFTMWEPTSDRTGYLYTINRHNDYHAAGATINLWEENGHVSQVWRWNGQTLRSKTNSNYCLNLHNNAHANGATINLWPCNGHASQNWVVVGDTLRPASNTNFCVNLHNNNRQNGGTINLWTCNNHESQEFWQDVE
jgi:hypothetical protein